MKSRETHVAQQPPGTQHPRFPHLFAPLQLGPLTVKNRILNAAHQPRFAHDGHYTKQYIAYHRERARGGAAVIVSQATGVNQDYLDLKSDNGRMIEEYRRVVAALRPYGARYFAELYHPGRQSEFTGFGAEIFHAPSAVPLASFGRDSRIPHVLDGHMIREIIGDFGKAARRCRDGGIDGIELHFAHGNLAQQFMSPLTNHRNDEWGGSLENRLRFAREVAEVVRDAVGRDLVVGCRLTGAEFEEGGLDRLDMIEIAGTMDEWQLLDYFSVTMGHYSDLINTIRNMPDMTFKPGLWAEYGRGIKQVVKVPTFLVGRINHPNLAEDLIATGCCDMVVMARGLIADPHFPSKAFNDQADEIRPCVGAMSCLGRHERGMGISCIYNPTVGRESTWGGELPRARHPRRVLVAGGGPAGLECARVAARRGHHVTLLERNQGLGGQLRIAARAPQREDLNQITEWLARQCEDAGVDIRLRTAATPELIAQLESELVIVATGATQGRLTATIADGVELVEAWTVLNGKAPIGRNVLVADETGDRVAFSVAQYLAEKGHRVVVATTALYPGSGIDSYGWRVVYGRLLELGVTFHPLSVLNSVTVGEARLRHLYTGSEIAVDGIDTVVSAAFPVAEDGLYRTLKADSRDVRLIGDAVAPRSVEAAVFEGQNVARMI